MYRCVCECRCGCVCSFQKQFTRIVVVVCYAAIIFSYYVYAVRAQFNVYRFTRAPSSCTASSLPLDIKKKLFLDILANDFSSFRLLGSTGKPDTAANRWPQFACPRPSSQSRLIISWALGILRGI